MDKRTFSYLSGRFRDYFRKEDLTLPPEAEKREWGHIPFTDDGKTFMKRHQSLGEMGGLDGFASRESPRHFYFSSSKYTDPSIPNMNEKGWTSADLIFDIDADHLSGVDEDATPYDEMLEEGKQMLLKLVAVLRDDFGFEDLEIVFSGGRGYHVHVRDDGVQELDRAARNEIVDYLTGTNIDFETITTQYPFGIPMKQHNGVFPQSGGWGDKYRHRLLETFDSIREDIVEIFESHSEDETVTKATKLLKDKYGVSNIGTERTRMLILVFTDDERYAELRMGNLAVTPPIRILAKQLLEQTLENDHLEIDEPVTTDTNRLIRVPGSLHGGSGLRVTSLDFDSIDSFEPLVDAVPEVYKEHEVKIEVRESEVTSLVGGEKRVLEEGEHTVPEYVAIHLMCREVAVKIQE